MRLTNKDRYEHFYTNKANCRNIWSLDGKKLEGEFFENQTLAIDGEAINKLGQLEDIEDGLGIDFLMLDKICKNGVYCYKKSIKDYNTLGKRLGNIIHIQNSDIHIQFFGVFQEKRMGVSIMGCIDFVYHSLPIKDYGKTWALTKEELL